MERHKPIDPAFLQKVNNLPSSLNYWHGMPTARIAQILSRQSQSSIVTATTQSEQAALLPLIELPSGEEIFWLASRAEELLLHGTVTHADLLSLTPRQFEELVAEIWSRFGFEVELTARTRDGGRDIVAVRKSVEANYRHLIECKRYDPRRKICVDVVRALYGVKEDERATKAILATTSTFTADAKRFLDKHVWELDGRDYMGILGWLDLVKGVPAKLDKTLDKPR